MSRSMVAARPPAAGTLIASILTSLVLGCTGAGGTAAPVAGIPSSAGGPSAAVAPSAPPTARATVLRSPAAPFQPAAFTGISPDPVPAELATRLQQALNQMARGGGMAATVMGVDGTWSGARGKAAGAEDVQVDSQFGIASVTKSLIAAQMMLLVEAGEVKLDDPATDHLPAAFDFDVNGATIRQLLDMHAGIPDWYSDSMEREVAANRDRVWTLGEVLELVGPNRRPAGTEFEYTDTNYVLLGLVIEHVREQRLVDVLREGVLRVEGTERLVYQPDEPPSGSVAMPDGEPGTALEAGGGFIPSLADASSAGPAGAIASDALSLARWWRAFCAGEIVSEASLAEMTTWVGGADAYGLGLFNPADPWAAGAGHLGSNFGYVSWAGCLPDDHLVVVVLTNQAIDDIGGLAKPLVMAARSG
jgi:D-alanyl-D-alanine carboxypeptidase